MFRPPGTTYCLLDFTDFPLGTRVNVPASNDFRIGDRVVFTPEGSPTLASDGGTNYSYNTTYYVVGGGVGNDFIELSATENGTPITVSTGGGVTITGALLAADADGNLRAGAITAASSGYADGTYNNVQLTGGTGTGGRGNVTVASGAVTGVVLTELGSGYVATDTLSATDASLGSGGGSGLEITLTGADVQNINSDTEGSHVNISYQNYEIVCQVTEWDLDFSRESIDVSTIPCTCGDASRLANFRTSIPGPATGEGSMTVLFTPDQNSTANRLIYSTLLADQNGASVKLYLNYIDNPNEAGCQADDVQSMFIEAPVVLNGFSVNATTTEALSATISFALAGPPQHMLLQDTGA